VSTGDVKLGKYADANGRVSMDVWESSRIYHRWIPEFGDNAKYELKAKTNKQKNSKVFIIYYSRLSNIIHNRKKQQQGE